MSNGLFTVYDKENTEYVHDLYRTIFKPVTVYGVRDDKNGYPHFLIYENREWKWVKAKRFVPNKIMD